MMMHNKDGPYSILNFSIFSLKNQWMNLSLSEGSHNYVKFILTLHHTQLVCSVPHKSDCLNIGLGDAILIDTL